MRNHVSCLMLLLVLSAAFALPTFATSLDWQVVSPAGSSDASSAHLKLSSTVGQAGTGRSASSNLHSVAGFWQDFSIGGGSGGCCVVRVGDANGQGEYPDEVTLGDIMLLVDVKFVSGDCSRLPCLAEADVTQDGGANPTCEDNVTLGDIMTLVDFLFITGPEVATLRDCL